MDFETEISHVIQFLECFMLRKDIPSNCQYIRDFLFYSNKSSKDTKDIKEPSIEEIQTKLIPHLELDLKYLMLLLEQYLIETVDNLTFDEIEAFPEVIYKQDNIEAVITYNYTHLFNKFYTDWNTNFMHRSVPKVGKTYYIHGELEMHNIVLGSGETLQEEDLMSMVLCNSFKKYFQSIYFRLSNDYQNLFSNYGVDSEAEETKDPLAKHFASTKVEPEYNFIIYGHLWSFVRCNR